MRMNIRICKCLRTKRTKITLVLDLHSRCHDVISYKHCVYLVEWKFHLCAIACTYRDIVWLQLPRCQIHVSSAHGPVFESTTERHREYETERLQSWESEVWWSEVRSHETSSKCMFTGAFLDWHELLTPSSTVEMCMPSSRIWPAGTTTSEYSYTTSLNTRLKTQMQFLGFHAKGIKRGLARNVALYVTVVPNFRSDIRWFVVIRRWLWRIPAAKPGSSLSFLHTQKPQTNKQRETLRARDLGSTLLMICPSSGIQYIRLWKVSTSQIICFQTSHQQDLTHRVSIVYKVDCTTSASFPIVAAVEAITLLVLRSCAVVDPV